MIPVRRHHRAVVGLLVSLLAAAGPTQAQVKVLDKVPTQQELREALNLPPSGDTPAARPRLRARGTEGLDWSGAAGAASAAAPSAPVPPVAPSSPAAVSPPPQQLAPAVAAPIQFDLNSARVSAASAGYVEAIARLMASEPALRLTVEGHTDASGDATRNVLLSWDRAIGVFRLLVERHGVDPQRLQPIGRGAAEPLDGMTPQAPANRRVQFRRVG